MKGYLSYNHKVRNIDWIQAELQFNAWIVSPAYDITMYIVRVTSDATFSISTRIFTYAQGIELLLCLLLSRIHVEL